MTKFSRVLTSPNLPLHTEVYSFCTALVAFGLKNIKDSPLAIIDVKV